MTGTGNTDGELPLAPAAAEQDDHALAAWTATAVGELLMAIRQQGTEGAALKSAGDQQANDLLTRLLAKHRPGEPVLSEESDDDQARLQSERVWIVDPLDGTREFSEPPRDDWAVHVALWERGRLTAGAVAQPALGRTFNTGDPPVAGNQSPAKPRIAVSRTRPADFAKSLAAELDADLVPLGSAGAKVMAIAGDIVDAYVHAGGQYEWDSAAPIAVARAAGLHTSRADGGPLRYNQRDVLLPDLLVCRNDLVGPITSFVERYWTANA